MPIRYNKIVRDRIPDIITASGKYPRIRRLSGGEYSERLAHKLVEEAEEFVASGNIEELADVLEVMLAILRDQEVGWEALESIRTAKHAVRGGFQQQILLIEVADQDSSVP
ncbi:MAG TPA: nucleoside triphosphate pyrophosphohydrolase [Thermomicrobiales bacterium]|nr:nucleoside triphosphate pyrophosphohydrolase [Thermomicrobiales bacterium]